MEARNHVQLCQEIESELRELCVECRKKFPVIKEYTERAILKIRQHREAVESDGRLPEELPEFPLDEVLTVMMMACETFQNKIVLVSLTCLQRLIHRRVLKDETVAIVINLMKEQATNGDESVQLKVLQTIMATPAHMTLLSELVVEQLMQLLFVLHNSASASVHHTACAGIRQVVEHLADRAAAMVGGPAAEASGAQGGAGNGTGSCLQPQPPAELVEMSERVRPVIQRAPVAIPTVAPGQAPSTLTGTLRMFYIFVQDLCVMADYDASSLSSRYAVDAGERMRIGLREGYWLSTIKFPRPLCLELLGTCVAAHPEVFYRSPECFALLRHNICAVLLKNLRGCFDFAILIRSIHLLQQILKCALLASLLMQELQVFLHLMLDLTTAERSPWQRATSLEFLKSVCENPAILAVLYDHSLVAGGVGESDNARTFVELVNSLSKLMHQVCFSSDWGALLQSSGTGGGPTSTSGVAADRRMLTFDVSLPLLDGSAMQRGAASLLGKSGLLTPAGLPSSSLGSGEPPAGGRHGNTSASGTSGSGGGGAALGRGGGAHPPSRTKLLVLMNEAEPPVIQPSFLVSLVVECVFAIVSTLYRFLLNADEALEQVRASGSSASGAEGGRVCQPLAGPLNSAQERCSGMLSDSWPSLVSALSLMLHGTVDEAFLQQSLRCLQTLLYCCSRLGLQQARETCLLQLARYAVPGQGHESEVTEAGNVTGSTAITSGSTLVSVSSANTLTPKNVLCFKALLNFCYCFGALLGVVGWTISLRAFSGLERVLHRAPPAQASELAMLRSALDQLFETTTQLPVEAVQEVVEAMGRQLRTMTDADEGSRVLERLVELSTFNLARLLSIWRPLLQIVLDVCVAEPRGELRGAAAAGLCRILSKALRKEALALSDSPEEKAQEELLRPLEELLHVRHEDTRARICEGLLTILTASGQELHPAAWGTTLRLVETASRLELERAGLENFLPKAPSLGGGGSSAIPHQGDSLSASGTGSTASTSAVLPTIFQLLELLVHDFMEYVPPNSVPALTSSIGAFARFMGLGVNSSLTAVGFLWNVADALARYHFTPGRLAVLEDQGVDSREAAAEQAAIDFEELWMQIFMHLRVLAVDTRPEVRNCAVKTFANALLSHGRKVGTRCYQRCLQDILVKVLSEVQDAARCARERANSGVGSSSDKGSDGTLIVHHSRDSLEKQWDETTVICVEYVRRVLSHFAEESGVVAFAPLAYTLLLQVQTTLQLLSAEVSGSALRALVDLMRIPASSQVFDVRDTIVDIDPAVPVPAQGTASVWLLGWGVLWHMVQFCMSREVPESLMETFASTLTQLRQTHKHLMTPSQHMVLMQLVMVLVTSPSFYLPSSQPFQFVGDDPVKEEGGEEGCQRLDSCLKGAVEVCRKDAEQSRESSSGAASSDAVVDTEVFDLASRSPEVLWRLSQRFGSGRSSPSYTKAAIVAKSFVDANKDRNADVRSMEDALQQLRSSADLVANSGGGSAVDSAAGTEDVAKTFLGSKGSPTHRTMLHICSSRLQHVQGFVFVLLEETPDLAEPFLEVFFLYQCCALFLDARILLRDTNKLALAARALCLLVVFCRRIVLRNLPAALGISIRCDGAVGEGTTASVATPEDHLEAFVGSLPQLFHVVTVLACCGASAAGGGSWRQVGALRASGLWKLAMEALIYLIEDSLPVLERVTLSPRTTSAYWEAVLVSMTQVANCGLRNGVTALGTSSGPADGNQVAKPNASEVEILAQAIGNLILHKVLACAATPRDVSERAVRLLGDLVELSAGAEGAADASSHRSIATASAASGAPSLVAAEPCSALGQLFDFCTSPASGGREGDSTATSQEVVTSCRQSAAALAARGTASSSSSAPSGTSAGSSTGLRIAPLRLPDREALLRTAVPILLQHVRSALAAYEAAEREATAQAAAAAVGGGGGAAVVVTVPQERANEVRFILSRLKAFHADDATLAAAAPVLPSDRARAACKLAGPRGLAMALLPELSALAGSSDARVSAEVRAVLEGLARELGF